MKKTHTITALLVAFIFNLSAQDKGLVNTSKSPYAKLNSINISDIRFTDGFWAERFNVCKRFMAPFMMDKYVNDTISHGFANFEIAAGLKEGEHKGPPFHDGDFYKTLEALIVVNSVNKDAETDQKIDSIISIIGKTQRSDGYIHTPVVIEQRWDTAKKEFSERLDFETYNMGHLMTAACIHYRVTGKTNFLDIAVKAADFLYEYNKIYPGELAVNSICPSHYMGIIEMYRTLGDPRYLELGLALINNRSMVKSGTDDNQDRIPFRQQTKAVGHAVRANYLYAGVTDVYLETGEDSLFAALNAIWHDVTERKMYITGGCGALYNGVSPDGTTYKQSPVQQVHQAYGRDYQLPNITAHNESCANIGNMLWNWRMLMATGDARYADVMETVMYNSLLAGVSLDGKGYFYTNPLCISQDLTYTLRWSKEREEYISYCNCCPPNTIRTIAETGNYFYSVSDSGLWINFYGSNELSARLKDGSDIEITQKTDYPWDGNIKILLNNVPSEQFSVFFRIPGWASKATFKINGKTAHVDAIPGNYCRFEKNWKPGDMIELVLPMNVDLIEANPLVEENRNQVAIKRGPVVYCLESVDIPPKNKIFDITIPSSINLKPESKKIGGNTLVFLSGEAIAFKHDNWEGTLYRKVSREKTKIHISLVPYFAWGNRGKTDMTVWMPVSDF